MTLPEWSLPAAVVAQWRATPIPENQIEVFFCRKKVQPHRSDQDSAVCSGKKGKTLGSQSCGKNKLDFGYHKGLEFLRFSWKTM